MHVVDCMINKSTSDVTDMVNLLQTPEIKQFGRFNMVNNSRDVFKGDV